MVNPYPFAIGISIKQSKYGGLLTFSPEALESARMSEIEGIPYRERRFSTRVHWKQSMINLAYSFQSCTRFPVEMAMIYMSVCLKDILTYGNQSRVMKATGMSFPPNSGLYGVLKKRGLFVGTDGSRPINFDENVTPGVLSGRLMAGALSAAIEGANTVSQLGEGFYEGHTIQTDPDYWRNVHDGHAVNLTTTQLYWMFNPLRSGWVPDSEFGGGRGGVKFVPGRPYWDVCFAHIKPVLTELLNAQLDFFNKIGNNLANLPADSPWSRGLSKTAEMTTSQAWLHFHRMRVNQKFEQEYKAAQQNVYEQEKGTDRRVSVRKLKEKEIVVKVRPRRPQSRVLPMLRKLRNDEKTIKRLGIRISKEERDWMKEKKQKLLKMRRAEVKRFKNIKVGRKWIEVDRFMGGGGTSMTSREVVVKAKNMWVARGSQHVRMGAYGIEVWHGPFESRMYDPGYSKQTSSVLYGQPRTGVGAQGLPKSGVRIKKRTRKKHLEERRLGEMLEATGSSMSKVTGMWSGRKFQFDYFDIGSGSAPWFLELYRTSMPPPSAIPELWEIAVSIADAEGFGDIRIAEEGFSYLTSGLSL